MHFRINTNPDVCIQCLLDSAVQHSPHFDWVVAYIGSVCQHCFIFILYCLYLTFVLVFFVAVHIFINP